MTCKVTKDITYFDGVLLIAIQLTALFGNSLFVVGFVKFPSLRNATNILLCCLVTADMIVAFGPMSITFAVYICSWGPRDQHGDIINKMYLFADVWCGTVSILSLTVIAMDRYFAIEWPFVHQRIVKPSLAVCTIIFVWLLSAGNAGLRLIPSVPRRPASLTNIMIAFAIPLVIMSFCYINIAITARKQTIRIAQLNAAGNSIRMRDEAENSKRNESCSNEKTSDETKEDDVIKEDPETTKSMPKNFSKLRRGTMGAYQKMRTVGKELKAAKTLAIVMGAFLVTWTPFMSLIIISYMYCNPPSSKCYSMVTATNVKYCKFLHYFSSALNPCLYVLLNKKWRDAFRKMLCCSKGHASAHDSRSSIAAGW